MMLNKAYSRYLIGLVCLGLVGCASTGPMLHLDATETVQGITGESVGFTLFGFIGIIHPTYSQARAKLHTRIKGEMAERGYVLENEVEEFSKVDLIIFSFPKKTITADIKPRKYGKN